ncbi:MAG: relaxase/mobilization nuclease domain-containing protein [Clostridia bacterium]|nr:relaxase/mobilization nuclease domain-containing protein [Clostridia bacterium]
MATTKLWKVVKRMDHVIDYATNKEKTKAIEVKDNYEMVVDDLRNVIDYARNSDKTEKEYYVSGVNCEPESAYEEMKDAKQYWNKKDGILAFHAYQSFKEDISPELAHKIGVELANEMWGDRFQVIVTTHLNTNHIHNHLVVNSVSYIDGKKYYSNRANTGKLRHISDEICREYGLIVLPEKPCKKSKINFGNYYKKSLYTDNYSNNAKRDLDLAIRQAYSYDDFIYLMKKLDYEIIFRANKISIRKEPYKRNIRIERRFGEDYSIDNIKRRIIEEQAVRVPFIESVYNYKKVKYPFAKRHKRAKAKGFIALYYHYCYLLKVFPSNVPQQKLPAGIRADVLRMEELSNEAKFLSNKNIKTLDDLISYKNETNFKINELLCQREKLWTRRKLSKDEDAKYEVAEEISSLNDKLVKLRREVELCEDIKKRIPKIEEKLTELDKQEELEKEAKDKKKIKDKKLKEE